MLNPGPLLGKDVVGITTSAVNSQNMAYTRYTQQLSKKNMKNIQCIEVNHEQAYFHPCLFTTTNNRNRFPSMDLIWSNSVAIEISDGFH